MDKKKDESGLSQQLIEDTVTFPDDDLRKLFELAGFERFAEGKPSTDKKYIMDPDSSYLLREPFYSTNTESEVSEFYNSKNGLVFSFGRQHVENSVTSLGYEFFRAGIIFPEIIHLLSEEDLVKLMIVYYGPHHNFKKEDYAIIILIKELERFEKLEAFLKLKGQLQALRGIRQETKSLDNVIELCEYFKKELEFS